MTTVINIFGAPGSGKSTTAAGIYYNLKLQHAHCEMVREYIKNWSWEGRKPGKYDQLYILGKQAKYESNLYGKVDYIITDSPIILSGFYEHIYDGTSIAHTAAKEFMNKAESHGVKYKNFWLTSHDNYDPRGRYQDASAAEVLELQMIDWLRDQAGISMSIIGELGEDRVKMIMECLNES